MICNSYGLWWFTYINQIMYKNISKIESIYSISQKLCMTLYICYKLICWFFNSNLLVYKNFTWNFMSLNWNFLIVYCWKNTFKRPFKYIDVSQSYSDIDILIWDFWDKLFIELFIFCLINWMIIVYPKNLNFKFIYPEFKIFKKRELLSG